LVFFLFCFWFAVVVVLTDLVPSLYFFDCLRSVCFTVRLPRLFVSFLSFVLSCVPDVLFLVLPRIQFYRLLSFSRSARRGQ
jgi:hypothetical protein